MYQYVLVVICLLACVAYVVWRVRQALTDPCRGCDGCALKDMKREKPSASCSKKQKSKKIFG